MFVTEELIGQKYQQNIFRYTLRSKFLTIIILNYGGIIQKIIMPDKNNQKRNIVLNYSRLEDYYSNSAYLGALIGRVAGRIPHGVIKIQDKKILLQKNQKINNRFRGTLHGGKKGFDKKIALGEIYQEKNKVGVMLNFFSKDREEGFPGEVRITSDYSLKKDNVFSLVHSSRIREPTLLNLTQHTYFNLSGGKEESIENHYLKIAADRILKINDNQWLRPDFFKVKKTLFDFQKSKKIPLASIKQNTLLKKFRGYDHYFIFSGDNRKSGIEKIALYHPISGRKVTIRTNQKGMMFYTGNYLDEIKSKKKFTRYQGLSLEVQDYPYFLPEKIPLGFPFFQEPRLTGQKYLHKTEYHFSVEK